MGVIIKSVYCISYLYEFLKFLKIYFQMPKRKLKNLMHIGELAFHGLTWNLNKIFRSQTFGENNGKMKGGLVICGDL